MPATSRIVSSLAGSSNRPRRSLTVTRHRAEVSRPPGPDAEAVRPEQRDTRLVAKLDDRDSEFRSAVFVGDGQHLVAVLSQVPWGDRLQLASEGLLVALAQGVERVSELAHECTSALRARGWEGDEDLAEQLGAALGERPSPMLRPLPVDLEGLAAILA